MSSSFSPDGFARESQSIWTGGAKDSWFNQTRLIKSRSLLHCERDYSLTKKQLDNGAFYVLAVDIARYGGNDTSIHVIKVLPRVGGWKKNVVYTLNITKTSLLDQAVRIKQLIRTYRPKEVVIDGNGVRKSLAPLWCESLDKTLWIAGNSHWDNQQRSLSDFRNVQRLGESRRAKRLEVESPITMGEDIV